MALSFPRVDIFTRHKIVTTKFALRYRQSKSRQANGITRGVDFGIPLWYGEFVSVKMTHDDCIDLEAMIASLNGVSNTFYAYDTRRPFPRYYPTGDFSNTGAIRTLGANGKSFSLQGLDPLFRLAVGDRISILIGGNRQLYTVQEEATSNTTGNTVEFEVSPHFNPALTVGTAVDLTKPMCNMIIDPDSVQFTDAGSLLGTVSFSGSQYF